MGTKGMLVRVLEIAPFDHKYCFGGDKPQLFLEQDWFRTGDIDVSTPEGKKELEKFILNKKYIDPKKAYLVLMREHTFTIGYTKEYGGH